MESLERDLEIYTRERRKAYGMVHSYDKLIKSTRAKIQARDEAIAAAEREAEIAADPYGAPE